MERGLRLHRAGDHRGAAAAWAPLAAAGNADAQFALGQLYRLGHGVAADLDRAESYYQAAAAQGHVTAMAHLATIYFYNRRDPELAAKAVELWQQAAATGEPRSQYQLAGAYFNGRGVETDPASAYAWMTLAAEQGLSEAIAAETQMRSNLGTDEIAEASRIADRLRTALPPAPTAPVLSADDERQTQEESAVSADGDDAAVASPTADETALDEAFSETPPAEGSAAPQPQVEPDSAAEPMTDAVPDAAPVLPANSWRIQLGSFRQPESAATLRSQITEEAAEIVDGLAWEVAPPGPGSRFYRLLIGPYTERNPAAAACDDLKALGFDCFPVAP